MTARTLISAFRLGVVHPLAVGPMGILGWIVLGLIVGAVAKMITPGRDPGGIILTIVIGIVGALLGGYIGRAFFHTDLGTFFELRTWVLGLLGAVILIYRAVTGGRRGIFHRRGGFLRR